MNNYISIRVILDNLTHHPLLQDLTLERAVNYAQEFLQIVGIPKTFEDKTAEVEINDYRGVLPCDFYRMEQVRTGGQKCGNSYYGIFRYTTDSFHMSENKSNHPELTYKLQGGCIFTSMKEGTIEIAYQAIAVDNEGYPLIPDDASFKKALELYIKCQCFQVLFDLGKVSPQVLQSTQQEYAWAVGQAQARMIMPSVDEMEALSNSLNTLLVRQNEHSKAFIDNGTKERIKLH